jgi:Tol biopolymer transport system component
MNARTTYQYLRVSLILFAASLIPALLFGQTYEPKTLHNGPSWSPNGMVIAYAASYSGDFNIYAIDIWSMEQQQITDHPANDLYPEWAPNGMNLAFYSDRPTEIPPFPPDTVVYNVRGLYETYARDGYRPSWAPDGNTITAHFRDEVGDYEIYTMNRQGKDRVPITDNMATDVHPRFSPDGSKIVFISDRDYRPEIYVMNADGSDQTRMTNSDSYDIDPVWSPDGDKIAFISNRLGSFDIFVMNADGSDMQLLTDDSPAIDIAPVWSPDGSKIMYSSNREGYFNLYVLDLNEGATTQLTNSDYHEFYGSWSPNGSRIAYLATEHGEPHLYLMNADGRRKRQLTR